MSLSELADDRLNEAVVHQILVVEDDPDAGAAIKSLLEHAGYTVTVARDGGQAHSSFVMRKPDFVILDLILPGASGYEICERLKHTEPGVPVLIVTAIELDESRDLAQRVGCDGYVTKPYDPERLLKIIPEIADRVWHRVHQNAARESRVRFACDCGRKFKVSPSHRGKTITCPDCGEVVQVPRYET